MRKREAYMGKREAYMGKGQACPVTLQCICDVAEVLNMFSHLPEAILHIPTSFWILFLRILSLRILSLPSCFLSSTSSTRTAVGCDAPHSHMETAPAPASFHFPPAPAFHPGEGMVCRDAMPSRQSTHALQAVLHCPTLRMLSFPVAACCCCSWLFFVDVVCG